MRCSYGRSAILSRLSFWQYVNIPHSYRDTVVCVRMTGYYTEEDATLQPKYTESSVSILLAAYVFWDTSCMCSMYNMHMSTYTSPPCLPSVCTTFQ